MSLHYAETAGFVEQLFAGLDNELYLKGTDSVPPTNTGSKTPPPPPAPDTVSVERMQSEDHSRRNEVHIHVTTLYKLSVP